MPSPKDRAKGWNKGMAKKELTIREAGAKGGKARAKNLDKKALSEIGKKGAQSRWAKKPAKGGN